MELRNRVWWFGRYLIVVMVVTLELLNSGVRTDRQTDRQIIPIGVDVKGRKGNFIEQNLASYADLFGDNSMFDLLDSLPKPDLIIASPPCESWSIASAMKDGNASWKKGSSYCGETQFIPRSRSEYKSLSASGKPVQFKFKRSYLQRINGELTAFNLIRIIARYRPPVFIIENPKLSRLWNYIDQVLGVKLPFRNDTYYSAYGYPLHKPTSFHSNIDLGLINEKGTATVEWGKFSKSYNERSNIPIDLILSIFDRVELYLNERCGVVK